LSQASQDYIAHKLEAHMQQQTSGSAQELNNVNYHNMTEDEEEECNGSIQQEVPQNN